MSDRVRFATWNDTAIPSYSSGITGFPTYLNDVGAKGSGDFYDVTLAEGIELFWRLRKVQLDVAQTFTVGTTPNREYYVLAYSGSIDWITNGAVAASELDLIVNPNVSQIPMTFGANGTVDVTYESGAPPFSGTTNFGLSGALVNYQGQLSMGSFVIGGDWLTNVNAGHGSTGNAVLFGTNYTLYHNFAGMTSVTNSYTVSKAEYWPYAALDASPIYNTTTGAQLQDPFN